MPEKKPENTLSEQPAAPVTFSEFPHQSLSDWEQLVAAESKGKTTAEMLLHSPWDGITMRPYYTHDDLKGLEGQLQFFEKAQALRNHAGWRYNEEITASDAKRANADALHALQTGAESLSFYLEWDGAADYAQLLKNIDMRQNPVFFCGTGPVLSVMAEGIKKYNPAFEPLKGALAFDPLSEAAVHGTPLNLAAFSTLAQLTKTFEAAPKMGTYKVSGLPFADAGAHPAQELAYALSAFVQYIDILTDFGFSPETAACKAVWQLGLGPDFFNETAKFRALRLLQAEVLNACGLLYRHLPLQAKGSVYRHSLAEPAQNLLRNTTQALAAIAGNTDYLSLLPHENGAQTQSAPARLARNVSTMLREEGRLGRTGDVAAGSPAIETLTRKTAEAAYLLFKETENEGGFIKALEAGTIAEKINATHKKQTEAYLQGKGKTASDMHAILEAGKSGKAYTLSPKRIEEA